MEIYNLAVTSNYVDLVDKISAHIEIDGCLRLVKIEDTNFATIEELKLAVESLSFD